MNNIFQKNILALKQKNPDFANKILTYIPNDLPQLVQENGAYNLQYKGKFIHNRQNPLGEAKEIFSMATNEPVAIHLIYGLGLGYLFQVACKNSMGSVILYEPDLNIIWTAFTLVDFSEDILKNNVSITYTLEETLNEIYKKSNTQNTPQMLSLPSAKDFAGENFDILVKKLQEAVGAYGMDLRFTREKFYPSLKMLLKNIPYLLNEKPLVKFKDYLKGKTAVVVSAGPTLDRNIETLKKYRDKYVLFTVGTAAKTLFKHGLTPDFLCIIETYNSSGQIEGLDLNNVYFITEPYANPELHKFKFRNTFSHISANSPINQIWAMLCGENIEEYWSKGTVSYTALNCARILGCSKIILVGQDLAYIEGQCYSKDSAYKDLICCKDSETGKWEIKAKNTEDFANALSGALTLETRLKKAELRLERLNNSLYFVKGINGDMIPTESVYAAFVQPLSEFAEHFNDREYINTSLVGAQIDGFKNLPLEEALSDSTPADEINLYSDFEYNKSAIFNNLKKELELLKTSDKYINDTLKDTQNIIKALKSNMNVSQDILKTLKKLSLNYLYLSGEFSNNCCLFDIITVGDKIDLDYEMKMMRDFSANSVLRICEKISGYLTNAKIRIKEVEDIVNESFNTAG